MNYKILIKTSNEPDFERTRWHIVNYLLREGNVIMRSSLEDGRLRPKVREEDYGLILDGEVIYAFHVEPLERGRPRRLEIIVACHDLGTLQRSVTQLGKYASLKDELISGWR